MTNVLTKKSNNDGLLSHQAQSRFELRAGHARSRRGKAKAGARILGNEAYFYICRLGSGARQKQAWGFLGAFGTSPR